MLTGVLSLRPAPRGDRQDIGRPLREFLPSDVIDLRAGKILGVLHWQDDIDTFVRAVPEATSFELVFVLAGIQS